MSDETPDLVESARSFFHSNTKIHDDLRLLEVDAPESLETFVKDSLLTAERYIDEDGWGDDGHYTMMLGSLQFGEVGFALTGCPLPQVQGDIHEWFPAWINTATQMLSDHWDDEKLPDMLQRIYDDHTGPSLWGAVVTAEAWVVEKPEPDASDEKKAMFQQWSDGDMPLMEHPDRKEMRILFAMDIKANLYIVERVRGEEAKYKTLTRDQAFLEGVDQGLLPLVVKTFLMLLIMMNNRLGYSPSPDVMKVWFPHLVTEEDNE